MTRKNEPSQPDVQLVPEKASLKVHGDKLADQAAPGRRGAKRGADASGSAPKPRGGRTARRSARD